MTKIPSEANTRHVLATHDRVLCFPWLLVANTRPCIVNILRVLKYTDFAMDFNIQVVGNRIRFPTPVTLHQSDFRAMRYTQNTKLQPFLPKSNVLSCSSLPVMP